MTIDPLAHRTADHPIERLFLLRWSPRAMSGEALQEGEIGSLFEAARWAPSSYNGQPWRFLYARRDTPHWGHFFDLLVPNNQAWCHTAAMLVVVVSRTTFETTGLPDRTHVFSAGAACENLALQATAMGLVCHGMAGFDADRARSELKVPEDFTIDAMMALGRPGNVDDLPEPLRGREAPSPRKALSEITLEGGF